MIQKLLITLVKSRNIFWHKDGNPVFPLENENQMEMLHAFAEKYGKSVEISESEPGLLHPETGRTVVGLGKAVHVEAKLFAHLTSRPCLLIESDSELPRLSELAVLVAEFSELSPALLDRLYPRSGQREAPGLIIAYRLPDLRMQVLTRAASYWLGPTPLSERIDFNPLMDLAPVRLPDRIMMGARTELPALQMLLGRGTGLLQILTHSDGFDALFGKAIFCPMGSPPEEGGDHEPPSCISTQVCHRKNISVGDALASGELFGPEMLSAKLMLWNVCFGIRILPSIVNPRWSIASRLLANPRIGAIITTWKVCSIVPGITESLTQDIAAGMPLGKAIARFNASEQAVQYNYKLSLLGDPAQSFIPANGTPAENPYAAASFPPTEHPPSILAELPFLRSYLAEIEGFGDASLEEKRIEALEAITQLELCLWKAHPMEKAGQNLLAQMQGKVLDYLFWNRKMPVHWWMSFAGQLTPPAASLPCFHCGNPVNSLKVDMRLPGVSPRHVSFCSSCGITADVPWEFRNWTITVVDTLSIRLDMGEFDHHEPQKIQGRLALQYQHFDDNREIEWPSDPDRLFGDTVAIDPEFVLDRPLHLNFTGMWDSELIYLRIPVTGRALNEGIRPH